MRKCVIFDMDGVIVDSEPLHMEVERNIFNELGINVSKEMHSSFVGISSLLMWRRIVREFGLESDAESLVELQRSSYEKVLHEARDLQPIPGVTNTMLNLKKRGYSLALASSSTHGQISFILNLFNISNLFNAVVSGEDVINGKPNPDIFLKAAKDTRTEPSGCIVIEDSENGITAAVKAGMKCLGFKNPNSGNQNLSGADNVIDKFDVKVIPLIEELGNRTI